jgi:hypothetical protein
MFAPAAGIAQSNTPLATVTAEIDFGTASVPPHHPGGISIIGTNGTIQHAAGLIGPAIGTAGTIQLNTNPSTRVLISCNTAGTMTNLSGAAGQTNRAATNFYLALGSATVAGPGQGVMCNGIDNVVIDTPSPTSAAQRVLHIGMAMNVTDVMHGGIYRLSSSAAGPLNVKIRQVANNGKAEEIILHIDAIARFTRDVALNAIHMVFPDIEVSGPVGAGDAVLMGTNGQVTYQGTVFSGGSAGIAGAVSVSGIPNGATLQVYCTQDATLASADGAATIRLGSVEIAPESAPRSFGNGAARCNGIGTVAALSFEYRTTTADQVFIGGRLDGAGAIGALSGEFSTTNPGGVPIRVDIILP